MLRPAPWSLSLLLAASLVLAGPAEDTAAGEESLRNGDLITAMALFRKAAEAGHSQAQARMGDLMEASELNADALDWYRKSAGQGDPAGDHGLYRMYLEGKGLPKDPVKAMEHLQRAVQKNHPPALDALAAAYRSGTLGMPKDLQRAAQLNAQAQALRPAPAKAAKP